MKIIFAVFGVLFLIWAMVDIVGRKSSLYEFHTMPIFFDTLFKIIVGIALLTLGAMS